MRAKGLSIAIALGTAILMLGAASAFAGEAKETSFPSDRTNSQVFVKVRRIAHEESEKFNLGRGQGVTIIWVDPRGPLGQVGFEEGDMILEVDGEVVEGLKNFLDLFNCVDHHKRVTLLAVDHQSGRRGYVQIIIP